MVKGLSRQVIVVKNPDPDYFEQAIFILKENAGGITDEMLLKEAKRIINSPKRRKMPSGPVWACGGALVTAIIWLFTIFL